MSEIKNINYTNSKTGENIFSVNDLNYHSTYNPVIEATRFADSVKISYNPKIILVIEPGLDYVFEPLKKKFPDCKIGKIVLFDNLKQSNTKNWDFIINYSKISSLKEYLINHFKEEEILSLILLQWPVAEKIFPSDTAKIKQEYLNAMEYSKTLLVTRQYFEQKWLLNSFSLLKYIKNTAEIIPANTNVPVVITASGPSLMPALPFIKKNLNKIFLIALSSSVSVLYHNQIIPDLILSTDGGYYAGQHLKKASKLKNTPIGLATEAFCSKKQISDSLIFPLFYNDNLCTNFLPQLPFKLFEAKRNGTISGTALNFAQKISNKDIFLCGLDLAEQKGFQHSQPNELEINSAANYDRLQSQEQKKFPSSLPNESLKIYEQWFKQQNNCSNVYRVMDANIAKNNLNQIKDIASEKFGTILQNFTDIKKDFFISKQLSENESKKKDKILSEYLNYLEKNPEILEKQVFPIDNLAKEHAIDSETKIQSDNLLKGKLKKLLNKIGRILND